MNKFFGIGLVILLLIGITSGVLLVQRQQQLKSKAADETVLTCKGVKPWTEIDNELRVARYDGAFDHSPDELAAFNRTACPATPDDCKDNPPGTNAPTGYSWVAVDGCKKFCKANNECPPNNSDPSNVDPKTSNWCYGFNAAPRCLQLQHSGGGTTCTANQVVGVPECRKCNSQGTGFPDAKGSFFPGTEGSAEWCACAQSFSTPAFYQQKCGGRDSACTPNQVVGVPECRKCGSNGIFPDAKGSFFPGAEGSTEWCACAQQYSDATFYQQKCGGGVTPPVNQEDGSTCDYKILESDTLSVASSIITGKKYKVQISMKNTGKSTWDANQYQLVPSDKTKSVWGANNMSLKSSLQGVNVSPNGTAVFETIITAPVLTDNNPRTEAFFLQMAKGTTPFGAACEPQIIQVQKEPVGLTSTKCYVIAEDATEIDKVTSCEYSQAGNYTKAGYTAHPTNLSYPFKTPLVAGTPRTIYVKFFDNNGVSSGTPYTKTIVYVPPSALSDVDCAYDSSGLATIYTIRGKSLGSQTANTKVKVGSVDALVTSWTATTITARMDTRLEGSNNVQVSLDDGKKLDGTCAVGTTTAALSVKNKCATAETINADDVEVSIYETGTQPFVRQKVRSDKDGVLAGFAPKLEKNKAYTALFKKPGFLTKKVEFNTTSGTAVVEPAVLIPGDIAPKPTADNVINSFDFSELKTQWDLVKDVTRTGDLNKDSRVNSFDWSCMKSSSNLQGDIFVAGSAGVGSTSPAGVGTTAP